MQAAPETSAVLYLDALLAQAGRATKRDDFLPGLTAALTIPDICGALRSPENLSVRDRYEKWLIDFTEYTPGEAALIYRFRCSLLHQGSSIPSGKQIANRVLFVLPGPFVMHRCHFQHDSTGQSAWAIDIPTFIDDLSRAVATWKAAELHLPIVKQRLAKSTQLYPNGLSPFIVGAPVVG
jgi:hypothetical protein